MLFKELHRLIVTRPLTLTVVSIPDGRIRVCVVPQALEKDETTTKRSRNRKEVADVPSDAIKALTTPLSLEGSPEELDAELPGVLTQYVDKHESLQASLGKAVAEIDKAVTAIEQREKEKAKADKAAKRNENKTSDNNEDNKSVQQPKKEELPPLWCTQPSVSESEVKN